MAVGDRTVDQQSGTWQEAGERPQFPQTPATGFINDHVPNPNRPLIPGQTKEQNPEADLQVELLPSEFPERWKNDFEGLIYLGALEEEVKIPYHKFVIKTLVAADKIGIIQLSKEYEGSVGYNRIYRAACVAAALVSVDGRVLVPSEKKVPILKQKYDYVTNSWYEPVIDLLYNKINELELRAIRVMVEMGIMPVPPELVQIFEAQDQELKSGGDDVPQE